MKRIALVLASLMIIMSFTFTGCSQGKVDEEKAVDAASGKTTDPAAEKSLEEISFKVSIPNFGVDSQGTLIQEEWLKRMESYMGMKLDIDWEVLPWNDYREKEKIFLAGGSMPDIMTSSSYSMVKEYGEQGILLEVSQYFDITPNYMEYVNQTSDPSVAYNSDGTAYGFRDGKWNEDNIEGAQSMSTVCYRFDLFKKHNIKVPETIDEFYTAAKKLKELYPDIYPINISTPGFTLQRAFAHIYHTNYGLYYNGEEFAYGPVEDSTREMLTYLHKLYEEELIDPEFLTDDDARATEKAVTGKTFIFPSVWAGMANHYNDNSEGMEWGLTMLPENPKYGTPWKLMSEKPGKSLQQRFNNIISAKTKYPEELVRILDYQYSDEMNTLINWGIEGTTYQVNAEGKKEFMPEIMNADNPVTELAELGVGSSMACRSGIVWFPQNMSANVAMMRTEAWYHDGEYLENKYWIATDEFGGKESIMPDDRKPTMNFTEDEEEINSTIMTPVNSYVKETVVKFITGEMDLDNWDNYLNEIKKMGDYEKVLKIYNDKLK